MYTCESTGNRPQPAVGTDDLFEKTKAKNQYSLQIWQTIDGRPMEIQYPDRRIVVSEKVLITLDRSVFGFTRILEQKTEYGIIV